MPSNYLDLSTASLGLLIARLVIGPLMAAHGAQKLFGWFGGYGLQATGEFMTSLGFRPGRQFAAIASITEVAAGLLITLGLLGPVGPALMLSVMIVAAVTVHWKNGVFAGTNGIELPLLYAAAAIGFGLTGFGQYSLDAVIGVADRLPAAWMVLAAGAVGGITNLALRRQSVSKPEHAPAT
jgi:putative oxidoreductase